MPAAAVMTYVWALVKVIGYTIGIGLGAGLIILVYNYAKYDIPVWVYEREGNQLKEPFKTRATVEENPDHNGRDELMIRKSWIRFWDTWNMKFPGNECYWPGEVLKCVKVGSHENDFEFLKLPRKQAKRLKVTDTEALDWFAMGIQQDLELFGRDDGFWKTYGPLISLSVIGAVLIFGFIYAQKTISQQSNDLVKVSNNIAELKNVVNNDQTRQTVQPANTTANTKEKPQPEGVQGIVSEGTGGAVG